MKSRKSGITLSAASASVFLAGCMTSGSTMAIPVCGMAGTSRDTCEVKSSGKTVCHIYVGGAASAPFVYPSELQVPKKAKKVIVVWHLMDKNAVFVGKADGPEFTSSAGEFFDRDTSDDSDGDSTSGFPARHFRVKFTNKALANPAKYTINYKDDAGNPAQCDPKISNSSD